ncbi:hypothetical protein F4780DRAFT_789119 [Xylariomycetidae sp. FL0641]|nr:hypothetical protein F4780DRAFT_789119 [Xylariomycetidae sp. FL0641]
MTSGSSHGQSDRVLRSTAVRGTGDTEVSEPATPPSYKRLPKDSEEINIKLVRSRVRELQDSLQRVGRVVRRSTLVGDKVLDDVEMWTKVETSTTVLEAKQSEISDLTNHIHRHSRRINTALRRLHVLKDRSSSVIEEVRSVRRPLSPAFATDVITLASTVFGANHGLLDGASPNLLDTWKRFVTVAGKDFPDLNDDQDVADLVRKVTVRRRTQAHFESLYKQGQLDLQDQGQKIKSLTSEAADLRQKANQAEDARRSLQTRLQTANERKSSAEEAKRSLQAKLETANERKCSAEDMLATAEAVNAELHTKLMQVKEQCSEHAKKLSQERASIEVLKNTHKGKMESLKAHQDTIIANMKRADTLARNTASRQAQSEARREAQRELQESHAAEVRQAQHEAERKLQTRHREEVEALRTQLEEANAKIHQQGKTLQQQEEDSLHDEGIFALLLEEARDDLTRELSLRSTYELKALGDDHAAELHVAGAELAATHAREIAQLALEHQQALEDARAAVSLEKDREMAVSIRDLAVSHESLRKSIQEKYEAEVKQLTAKHEEALERYRRERVAEVQLLTSNHAKALEALRNESNVLLQQARSDARTETARLKSENESALQGVREACNAELGRVQGELADKSDKANQLVLQHMEALERARNELTEARAQHRTQLEQIEGDSQASARKLTFQHGEDLRNVRNQEHTRYDKELQRVKADHEAKFGQRKDQYDEGLRVAGKVNEDLAKKLQLVENAANVANVEIARLTAVHSKALDDLRNQASQSQATIAHLTSNQREETARLREETDSQIRRLKWDHKTTLERSVAHAVAECAEAHERSTTELKRRHDRELQDREQTQTALCAQKHAAEVATLVQRQEVERDKAWANATEAQAIQHQARVADLSAACARNVELVRGSTRMAFELQFSVALDLTRSELVQDYAYALAVLATAFRRFRQDAEAASAHHAALERRYRTRKDHDSVSLAQCRQALEDLRKKAKEERDEAGRKHAAEVHSLNTKIARLERDGRAYQEQGSENSAMRQKIELLELEKQMLESANRSQEAQHDMWYSEVVGDSRVLNESVQSWFGMTVGTLHASTWGAFLLKFRNRGTPLTKAPYRFQGRPVTWAIQTPWAPIPAEACKTGMGFLGRAARIYWLAHETGPYEADQVVQCLDLLCTLSESLTQTTDQTFLAGVSDLVTGILPLLDKKIPDAMVLMKKLLRMSARRICLQASPLDRIGQLPKLADNEQWSCLGILDAYIWPGVPSLTEQDVKHKLCDALGWRCCLSGNAGLFVERDYHILLLVDFEAFTIRAIDTRLARAASHWPNVDVRITSPNPSRWNDIRIEHLPAAAELWWSCRVCPPRQPDHR